MGLKKEFYLKILIFVTVIAILFVLISKIEHTTIKKLMVADRVQVISYDEFKDEMLEEINKRREDYDLGPLERNVLLDISASQKAEKMIEAGVFLHNWGERDSFSDEIYISGYIEGKNNIYGENLACGYSEPEDAVKAWMTSFGHRENLLKEKFKDMGIGIGILKEEGEECFLIVLHLGG